MVLLDINLPKHAMNYVKIRHCMYFIFLHVYKKNISFVYHMMSKNNVRFSMDGLFIQQRCHCQCHPFIQKYLSSMFCYILTLFEIEFVSHVEKFSWNYDQSWSTIRVAKELYVGINKNCSQTLILLWMNFFAIPFLFFL